MSRSAVHLRTLCLFTVIVAACSGGREEAAKLTQSAVSPKSEAIDVPLDSTISVTFDRQISRAGASTWFVIVPAVAGTATSEGASAKFMPTGPLEPSTKYAVTVTGVVAADGGAQEKPVSWSFTTVADATAPAIPSDFAAGAPTGTGITLTWTAPGDDGATGTAKTYELRKATGADCDAFAEATFATGAVVADVPAPKPAGTAETFVVTGLVADTRTCFVLKTIDDAGNASFSASASATTLDTESPGAAADFVIGERVAKTITVEWKAPYDNGTTGGPVASYALSVATGACPAELTGFVGAPATAELPTPAAPGTPQSATVTNLRFDTAYCFLLVATDEAGHTGAPASVEGRSRREDEINPGSPEDVSATLDGPNAAIVKWTLPSDNGDSSLPGDITSLQVRLFAGVESCGDPALFETGLAIVTPAVEPPGTDQQATIPDLANDTAYCVAVRAVDDGANVSPVVTAAFHTPDVIFPDRPSILALSAAITDTGFDISWLAVGDDEDVGTATKTELRMTPGLNCALLAVDFESWTLVPTPAPLAAGMPQSAEIRSLSPGTSYCVALIAFDNADNGALSEPLRVTTTDTSAPLVVTLAAGAKTSRTATLTFLAPAEDGALGGGPVSSYDLRFVKAATCPTFDATSFEAATVAAIAVTPAAPGTAESISLVGLTPGSAYCFALRSADDAGNKSPISNVLQIQTDADTIAPATITLTAQLQSGGKAKLTWTAVANDGTSAASGAAAAYDLRRVSRTIAADQRTTPCAALGASDFATATVVAMSEPGSPGSGVTVLTDALAENQAHCYAIKVRDDATPPNESALSNWAGVFVGDRTPPAKITTLAATVLSATSARLTWTAVGDDGNTGTATKYEIRRRGACPAPADFNFPNTVLVENALVPKASGEAETFDATGLTGAAKHCFAIIAIDEDGNTGEVSNLVEISTGPSPASQIALVRAAIGAAIATPITGLNLSITGAIVTYTKVAAAGAAVATQDHAGFFLQGDGSGPAIYVLLDPATAVAGGVARGDQLDLVVTEGKWINCSACTRDNSMWAISQATITRTATGQAIPAPLDLTAETVGFASDIPAPQDIGGWSREAVLSKFTGTIDGPFTSAGTIFFAVPFRTTGSTAIGKLQLRSADSAITGSGLAAGCTVTVGPSPLWRFTSTAQAGAWVPGDLTLTGCPSPTLSVLPSNGASNVELRINVIIGADAPLDVSTLTAQTTAGTCSGNVQLSADNFTSCLAFSGAPLMSSLNRSASLAPAALLAGGTQHKLKITTGVKVKNGKPLAAEIVNSFGTLTPVTCSPQVVISQVYGGGGNSGAPYTNDFIELHNRGTTAVNVTGWSVQYASASGTFSSTNLTALSGVIPAGGYYLVQQGAGTTVLDKPLPQVQATGAITMSGTAGKVALVLNSTALGSGGPTTTGVVDFVGFGSATAFEGTGPTPAPSNTTSVQRLGDGCADTGQNGSDFVAGAPTPRGATANPALCGCLGE